MTKLYGRNSYMDVSYFGLCPKESQLLGSNIKKEL